MRLERSERTRVEQAPTPRTAGPQAPAIGVLARRMVGLQHAAGNSAVARSINRLIVQRHLGPTMPDEVGEPTAQATPGPAAEPGVAPGTSTGTTTGSATTTGTGTGTGAGGAARGAPSRQAQIYERLGRTDTGRWALGVITRWRIPVDVNFAGVGSFHQAGRIFINRSLSIDAAAIVTIHEAQHANTFKSGRSANIQTLSRSAYVTRMIADEAEATVRQIEGSVPMMAAGANVAGSAITQGLIDRYRAAFYRKRDELQASDPSLTRAQINARCRTFARDTEVTSWFHDGTFVTSTGGAANVTYTQHYGAQWDAVHNPPGSTPATGGGT